jgi:hypothetical protein
MEIKIHIIRKLFINNTPFTNHERSRWFNKKTHIHDYRHIQYFETLFICILQIQRANHFQKICEDQLSTQRFLETEIENLKMMQEQTERRKHWTRKYFCQLRGMSCCCSSEANLNFQRCNNPRLTTKEWFYRGDFWDTLHTMGNIYLVFCLFNVFSPSS